MNRTLSFFFSTALVSLVPFACTATLDESCLSGPCEADKPPTSAVSSSSSSGGEGGGGGGAPVVCPPNKPTTGQFPCDVHQVLTARCYLCHTDPPVGGAPFPLLQYEQTQEDYFGMAKWEWMRDDIEKGRMPFGQPMLAGADLETMRDWFAQCAPPVPDGTGCE